MCIKVEFPEYQRWIRKNVLNKIQGAFLTSIQKLEGPLVSATICSLDEASHGHAVWGHGEESGFEVTFKLG